MPANCKSYGREKIKEPLSPMNYILIIGVFESIFLILLLLGKKNKVPSDFFLGIIFFLYALSIGGSFVEIYNFRNNFPYPRMINLSWLILFLHGPALWFYVKSITESKFRFKPIILLHFLPFLTFFTIHYFNFIRLSAQEKIMLVEDDLFKEQIFYKVSVLSIGIITILYNLWAIRLIKRYRVRLMQNYSKIEDIDLTWLRTLSIAALICYSVNMALFNLDLIFHFATYKFLMALTYSFASVYILLLGYFGLKQPDIFTSNKKMPGFSYSSLKNTNHHLHDRNNEFVTGLLEIMETRKPYLDPDLTLSGLGRLINVKPELLSRVINAELNQNFFDFINSYRIGEFKNQCISKINSHLSILGIAYNCGFNSKASFYRAFKKFEGISPTAYINSVS